MPTKQLTFATSKAQAIIYNDHLNNRDLLKLFENDALAMIVRDYHSVDLCNQASNILLKDKIQHYENAPSIGRYGMAFYETENHSEKVNLYYKTAISNINKISRVFSPYLSPIDKFRLELEEVWNAGATIQNIHDRKIFVGLCRLLESNIDFLPHQDIFYLDAIGNNRSHGITTQLAVNIYLKIPHEGGEIELWDFGLHEDEYINILDEDSYGISRNKLPEPFVKIKPNQGDLILFNSRVLHAIRPGKSVRVSISCFVGYSTINEPLKYWS